MNDSWQPIATAPRDGTRILGWCRVHGQATVEWSRMLKRWEVAPFLGACDNVAWSGEIDAWMPLPPPPAA